LGSSVRKSVVSTVLAIGLMSRIVKATAFLIRFATNQGDVLAAFCRESHASVRFVKIRFMALGIGHYIRLFEILGVLPKFHTSPEQHRLRLILRALKPIATRSKTDAYPLRGHQAIQLNAMIVRVSFRRWLGMSLSQGHGMVLGRYSSASEALVEFLEYCRVDDDDFFYPVSESIGHFVEEADRKHKTTLSRGSITGRIAPVPGGPRMWRLFVADLRTRALWAGFMAYHARFERVENSLRRQNRDVVIEMSLDAQRKRTRLLADASEQSLRVMLVMQLNLNALQTLVNIQSRPRGDHRPQPPLAAMKRAVADLDSNLEKALSQGFDEEF